MEKKGQNKIQNPVSQYRQDGFPKQLQEYPGVQSEMKPIPDCGE